MCSLDQGYFRTPKILLVPPMAEVSDAQVISLQPFSINYSTCIITSVLLMQPAEGTLHFDSRLERNGIANVKSSLNWENVVSPCLP